MNKETLITLGVLIIELEGHSGQIHNILNETVWRKLTIKEYQKLTRLIGKVFDARLSALEVDKGNNQNKS